MKRVKKPDRPDASSPSRAQRIGSPSGVSRRSTAFIKTRVKAALLIIAGALLVFGFILDNYLRVLPLGAPLIDRFFSISQLHHESFVLLGLGFILGVALMYGLTDRD